jgi:hypothetical protein
VLKLVTLITARLSAKIKIALLVKNKCDARLFGKPAVSSQPRWLV